METFTVMIESRTINTMNVKVERKDTAMYMSDKLIIELGQRKFIYEPLRFDSMPKRNNYGYNKYNSRNVGYNNEKHMQSNDRRIRSKYV